MSRMTNDLMDISELAHHGPENIIISTISIVASFIYLSTIDIYLTLIIFCAVPFLLLIAMLLKNKMHKAFSDSRKSDAVINAALESSISGIRVTESLHKRRQRGEKSLKRAINPSLKREATHITRWDSSTPARPLSRMCSTS